MRSARRASGLALSIFVAAAALFGDAKPSAAFGKDCFSKWANGFQTLRVQANVPQRFQSAITASRSAWNGIVPDLYYYYPIYNATSLGNFSLQYKSFSSLGWDDVAAATYSTSNVNPHVASYIYLNSDWTWYTDGTMNVGAKKVDVRTIVTHEIGHASGLGHPNCDDGFTSPDEVSAVMNPNGAKKWALKPDDTAGIRYHYPQ